MEEPNSALVVKNLPFDLPLEILQEALSRVPDVLPVSTTFRSRGFGYTGIAFVNYKSIDEATVAHNLINGPGLGLHVGGGRRVLAEYKRKSPDRDEVSEEEIRQLWVKLKDLRDGDDPALEFPPSLSAVQRKAVHRISEKLGLTHVSEGEGANRHIVVSRVDKSAYTLRTPAGGAGSWSARMASIREGAAAAKPHPKKIQPYRQSHQPDHNGTGFSEEYVALRRGEIAKMSDGAGAGTNVSMPAAAASTTEADENSAFNGSV